MGLTLRMLRAMRARVGLLASPVFAATIAMLLLNDRVLKHAMPGLVTGKLSDLAGLAMVGILLVVISGRPAIALSLTAAAWIGLKTVPGVAELVAPMLGGVTRRDPTDLVVLAVLPVVGIWTVSRLRDPDGRRAQPATAVLLGGLSLIAAIATSCSPPVTTDLSTSTSDGRILVAKLGTTDYPEWAVSPDGVQWRSVRKPPSDLGPVETSVCGETIGCFRVRNGDRVEQRRGSGEWQTAFTFSQQQIDNRGERNDCVGAIRDFTSLAIVGRRVVAGMGVDGVLVRQPDGQWVRRALLSYEPLRTDGARWMRRVPAWVFLGVIGLLGLYAFAVLVRRRARYWWGVGAALVGAAAFFFGFGFIVFFFDFADAWIMSLVLGGIVIALVASVESARHFRPSAAMMPSTPFVDGRSAQRIDDSDESADFPDPPTP